MVERGRACGFRCFFIYQFMRPEDVGLTSLVFWAMVAVGLLGLVLTAPGMRVRGGQRPEPSRE
jgi:hypothetical protein